MASICHCAMGAAKSLRSSPAIRNELKALDVLSRRAFSTQRPAVLGRIAGGAGRQGTSLEQEKQLGSTGWVNRLQKPLGQTRFFSRSTPRWKLKTMEQIKARNRGGPLNLTAAVLFVATAAGLYSYLTYEKERMARQRIAQQTKGIGKPKVGGRFNLVDQDGNTFTSDDMSGQYALVYFGFTHCPDICPDELDKMALMYDKVIEKTGQVILPIMITCDPARDTPAVLKEYLAEFHPDIIGLTGSYENIKDTCKAYRVYFSTPPEVKPGQDYLVDHSIYFYLMDPEGDFVEAIGRNFTADAAAKVIIDHIKDWEGPLKKQKKRDRWA